MTVAGLQSSAELHEISSVQEIMLNGRYDQRALKFTMLLFLNNRHAGIAQLGERQTEDLKVPGSIPGHGIVFIPPIHFTHQV